MTGDTQAAKRTRRAPKPIDAARLEELALAYVARFATSAAKLEGYLARKLRERGWAGEGDPPVARLVARYVELGYVDDAAFARARAGSLLRRGYGPRRIGQALGQAGIDEDTRADVRPDEGEKRLAALTLARKRGFGPFGRKEDAERPIDRDRRERQLAAMLRAGHTLDTAREIVDALSQDAAEQWVAEAQEEH
ncbi:MAG TPA: RecX family transcriptional regulator [Croceibacterium sp.]|nr:RecX family transcriptional regulator [Croceibacterium sp.]